MKEKGLLGQTVEEKCEGVLMRERLRDREGQKNLERRERVR